MFTREYHQRDELRFPMCFVEKRVNEGSETTIVHEPWTTPRQFVQYIYERILRTRFKKLFETST
jgi:hypothetical protein